MPNGTDTRSVTDLIRELRDETSKLFRQEVALAKTELTEKATRTTRNITSIAVGGFVAYAGLLFLLAALTAALTLLLVAWGLEEHATWLAPLIIGGLVALIGYGMMQKGITTLKNESAVPERTVRTLKEDKQWVQSKVT